MIDPETAHAGILVRQSKTIGRMAVAEAGRVEIHTPPALFGPIHPRQKMSDGKRVTIYLARIVGRIVRMKIQPERPGNELRNLIEVGGELGEITRLARIIARGDATGPGVAGRVFKTGDAVALPAMQGDRRGRESRERGIGIDAPGGELFFG